MSYNFEQIKQWKKEGKSWEWIAQQYKKKVLTVQRWYYRKNKEFQVLNAGSESEPSEVEKKDMSFFRFIYKELTGKHSRYDSLSVLQLKIANILIELAKSNGD